MNVGKNSGTLSSVIPFLLTHRRARRDPPHTQRAHLGASSPQPRE